MECARHAIARVTLTLRTARRLEDEAESLISEARTECEVELERIKAMDPTTLWRNSARGKQLLEKHDALIGQMDAERRAWQAELHDLELNEEQQLALSQRVFDEEKSKHAAEVGRLTAKFENAIASIRDGTFQDQIGSAVAALLEKCGSVGTGDYGSGDALPDKPEHGDSHSAPSRGPRGGPKGRRGRSGRSHFSALGGGEFLRRYGREWEADTSYSGGVE